MYLVPCLLSSHRVSHHLRLLAVVTQDTWISIDTAYPGLTQYSVHILLVKALMRPAWAQRGGLEN